MTEAHNKPEVVRRAGSKWRAVLLLAFGSVIFAAAVYTVAAAGLSRRDYGTFAFWGVPNRIGYCGRRYFPNGTQLGNERQFIYQDSGGTGTWTLTSHTFLWRPIYAVLQSKGTRSVCTMTMYIPLGGQRWQTYSLSGGP